MSFNNQTIQNDYQRYHQPGQRGGLAQITPAPAFLQRQVNPTQTLAPGQPVFIDANNQWFRNVGDPQDATYTHIISFEVSDLSTPLSSPLGNQTTQILYPPLTERVKGMYQGVIFLPVSVNAQAYTQLAYNEATGLWIQRVLSTGDGLRLSVINLNPIVLTPPETFVVTQCLVSTIS